MSSPWIISDSPTPPSSNGGWTISDSPTPPSQYEQDVANRPGVPLSLPNVERAPQLASSLGDIASTVGSHLKNMVAGPVRTFTAPVTDQERRQDEGGWLDNPITRGIYRMGIEPSISPAAQAFKAAKEKRYGDAARSAESAIPIVGPWADQIENDVQQHGAIAGLAGLGTDIAAPVGAGKLLEMAPAAAQDAATGIMNRTVGSLKKDFARGANPGRGYLAAGGGPAASMESLAEKASGLRSDVGQKLGQAYQDATAKGIKIPATDVQKAVHSVIDDAKNSAQGPGVLSDPAVYDELKASFDSSLQDAANKGGFTPQELWDIRSNMDRNLNWGDQSKLNLTKTQQRVSGAIGGILKDAVPGAKELSQQYQDLTNFRNRAAQRALTHSAPLTSLAGKAAGAATGALTGAIHSPATAALGAAAGLAADSVPVKSALAFGLKSVGKGLEPFATDASNIALPGSLATQSHKSLPGTPGDKEENENPQNINDDTQDKSSNGVTSSISQPTPETHQFSVSSWAKAHPDEDPDEARQAAETLGYDIVD